MMDVKTARKLYDAIEKLLGDNAAALLTYELDGLIAAAEVAQEEVDEITEEERAGCAADEEFECEADLREAMEAVETVFEEIIGKIDDLRAALNKAEEAIEEAFNPAKEDEEAEAA